MPTVLCVDDHKYGSAALHATLETHGYELVIAPEVTALVPLLTAVDAVVLDCHMEDANVAGLASAIRQANPQVPIVMYSACCGQACDTFTLADACVPKGDSPAALLQALDLTIRAARYGLCRSVPDTRAA